MALLLAKLGHMSGLAGCQLLQARGRWETYLHVFHPLQTSGPPPLVVQECKKEKSENTQGLLRPRLETSMLSLLPHSIGQSKSPGMGDVPFL